MKKYVLKNKLVVLIYLIMSLISSGMTVYLSIILRDIIDVAVDFELGEFHNLLIISIIFFVLFGVARYVTEVLYAWVITRAVRHVREDVFDGIVKQDLEQFESVNSADYISALTNDINLLEENYFSLLAEVAGMVMLIIIAIGFMIYISFTVAAGLLVTLIVLIGAQALFSSPIRKRQTRLSKSLSSLTIKMKDIFSGFEVIKSYQMNNRVKKSFQASNDEVVKSNFAMYHISTIAGSIADIISLFLEVGVVFFSAYLIIQGRLTPGEMIGLLIVSGQITGPVQELGQTIPMIIGSKEIIERLEGFVMQKANDRGNQVATFSHSIRVEKLEFTYPEQEISVLKGVNFTFEKNKKYALTGKSGCGKTTFVKVLIGHLSGYSGQILYDQVELGELEMGSFNDLSSLVHQSIYMFDEDIEQNIHLHREYGRAELQSAVFDSGVSLFLEGKRTLQTKVGENGANLSGGERQRIAVARALIQNKPLLILDEGTSAVDKQTGSDIESRLLTRDDLTLLTITHTLDEEMLSQYDEIIYMEEGVIVESGSFADLLDLGGKFSQYMFPDSVMREKNQSLAHLDETFNQYGTPHSALGELSQNMKDLDGKLSQHMLPDSALKELNQNMKRLYSKFDQHMVQISVLEELNQGMEDLRGKLNQSTSPTSVLKEQDQSLEGVVSEVKSIYFS